MLFYISLLVASVIVALIVLYLYNALVDVGRVVYRAMLPSSRENRTRHLEEPRINTTINDTPTPWGWESRPSSERSARPHPAVPPKNTPWGWKGNGAETREHSTHSHSQTENAPGFDAFLKNNSSGFKSEAEQKPAVGWPYREEKFEFASKAYKVTRKTKPKKTNLKTTGTPWGW